MIIYDDVFNDAIALYQSGERSAEPFATMTLKDYLKWVKTGATPFNYQTYGESWKSKSGAEVMTGSPATIKQLRAGVTSAEKKALKRGRLTGATFSHCNPTGKSGVVLKRKEAGEEDSGTCLVGFDIDGIATVEKAEAERDRLFADIPFVLSSSLSASGKGVWLLVALSRPARDKSDFANIWWMLAVELQEKHKVTIGGTSGKGSTDTAPSNMVSLRFYTHDPDIKIRRDECVERYDLPEPDALPNVKESKVRAGLDQPTPAKLQSSPKQQPSTRAQGHDDFVCYMADGTIVVPKHKDADRFVAQCRWMVKHKKTFIPDRKEFSGFIIRAKSMGIPYQKIVDICRTQPNFDEAIDPADIAKINPRADVDGQVAVAFSKLKQFGYEPASKTNDKQVKSNDQKVKGNNEDEEETPPAEPFIFNKANFNELEALDTTNTYFVPKKITALFADAGVGKTGLYLYWIAQATQAGKKVGIIANDMSKEEFRPYFHAYGMVEDMVTLYDEEQSVFESDLKRWFESNKPDIIVIDTFDSWLEQVTDSFLEPGIEFNVKSPSHWVKARQWLHRIIAHFNIAVMAIFHVPQKSNPFMLPHSSKLKGLLFRTWLLVAKENGQLMKWGRSDIANCFAIERPGTICLYPDKQRSADRQDPKFFNFDRELPDDVRLNPDDDFKPRLPSEFRPVPFEKCGEFFSSDKTSDKTSDDISDVFGKTSDKTSDNSIDVLQTNTLIAKVRHLSNKLGQQIPEGKIVDNLRKYNSATVHRMLREAANDGLLIQHDFGTGDRAKFSIPTETIQTQ